MEWIKLYYFSGRDFESRKYDSLFCVTNGYGTGTIPSNANSCQLRHLRKYRKTLV